MKLVEKTVYVPDDKATGASARAERIKAGITLREMARRMEYSTTFIVDLERGRRRWNQKLVTRFKRCLAERKEEKP